MSETTITGLKPKELKKRIEAIEVLMYDINLSRGDWREKDKLFWDAVLKLDADAGPEFGPGKHIKFQVADGYAHYIVIKVGTFISKLHHLDYMDGYGFAGVVDSKIMTASAKQIWAVYQSLSEVFGKE